MPLFISKKDFKKIVQHLWTYTILIVFGVVLVQPHLFAVSYNRVSDPAVQAAYASLLEASMQQNDGAIQFETLLVAEDGSTQLTYVVRPGDTLSSIAKNFGTTTSAIVEANGLANGNMLRTGAKLVIGYDEGIIHDLTEETTIAEFAKEYQLNLEDLMTLNYVDDPETVLEPGQQLFLDLNKIEAEAKGLIEKRSFQALDLDSQPIPEPRIAQGETDDAVEVEETEPTPTAEPGSQEVITAEQTDEQLKQLNEPEQPAEEAPAPQPEPQPEQAPREPEQAAPEAAPAPQPEPETPVEEEQPVRQACEEGQCFHKGKCWTLPTNAYCAPEDDDNAWLCKEGYVDTGRACITQEAQKEKVAKATAPKKGDGILEQWYFNPYEAGYSNGWGGGHCTHYAGYYWYAKYGITTNWRGNAKYWYDNASSAGWQVGQSPEIGSIVVMKYGSSGWNPYGHVGAVIAIDRNSRQILIEDMNYVGRYIVSQHWIDMDSTSNPIIGYIYPRKQ